MPDIKVSGTFKDYYESLNKRLKYLHKLLLDFKSKRLAMINKNRAFVQYNSRDLSINDTRSNFLNEQNQNFSRPQAFAKVTYHGFFKCEGKCYPNTQLELCWKILLITIFY